jgi:3-phenylpropionate/trans-cinnamate dioxygenase ferredoxin subunit
LGDEIMASDDVCTHAFALLSTGWFEGCEIECPLHGARFDVRTGKVLCGPATKDLSVYPVKVEDDQILLGLGRSDC